MRLHKGKGDLLARSLVFLASSFILAFCLQVTVHELGHFLTGLLVGAQGGQVFLHPFYNSQVVFKSTPGVIGLVLVGVMGIGLYLLLATLLGSLAWRRKNPLFLPILMWGAIAYIGEGIGLLSSLAVYPEYYEDITQLFRLGIPSTPIIVVSVLFVLIGLIWMALVMPTAGLAESDPFWKRLAAYLCCLPLYFGLAIVYIQIFNPTDVSTLDVRTKQLLISLVFALLLAILHRPIHGLMKRILQPRAVIQPQWSQVGFSLVSSAAFFVALFGYSTFFN
ncbi:MAG: hypothetical protein L6461_15345 [Anaerolineae bacterium]|nr:hypothetical protein [Anaerolineae bacterium]